MDSKLVLEYKNVLPNSFSTVFLYCLYPNFEIRNLNPATSFLRWDQGSKLGEVR